MRTLRLALAGLFAALGLVALTGPPSQACSCVVSTTADDLDRADVVFTGTLTDLDPPPRRRIVSSTDPNTFTFDVDRVYAGDVPATAVVQAAMSSASCGIDSMAVGTRYAVFATEDREGLETGLCTGTGPADPGLEDELERLSGVGDRRADDAVARVVVVLLAFFGMPLL